MHKGMRVWDCPIYCNLGNPLVVIPWKKNDSLYPSTCQLPVTPYLRMKPWEFMPHPWGTFDWLDLEQVTQLQFLPEYSSHIVSKRAFSSTRCLYSFFPLFHNVLWTLCGWYRRCSWSWALETFILCILLGCDSFVNYYPSQKASGLCLKQHWSMA